MRRRKSKRQIENEVLIEIITDIFHEHKGRYGARRIQKVLENKKIKANTKRISRLMSEASLLAKGARKSYKHYPNKAEYPEKENIFGGVFSTNCKNKIWVGDITYIHTKCGFLYLSVFIDIFTRKGLVGLWILV